MTVRSCVLSLVCLAALAGPAVARDARLEEGWTDYRNERFGFSLRYPSDLFQPEKVSEAGDGQVFVSRDGGARLLVGALRNDAGQSPAAYQDAIARESTRDTGSTIGGLRVTGSCSRARATARPSTRKSCSAALAVSSTALRWSIPPTSGRRSTGRSRGWKNHSGPAESAGTALPPRLNRRPRRLASRPFKTGAGTLKAHARQWRIASRDRGGTTSSSSCGGRARLMTTNTCVAPPRDSRSACQKNEAPGVCPAPLINQ